MKRLRDKWPTIMLMGMIVLSASVTLRWLQREGKSLETVVGAALASLGGIGAYLLQEWHRRREEEASRREAVVLELQLLCHVLAGWQAAEHFGSLAPAATDEVLPTIREWDRDVARYGGQARGFADLDDAHLRVALTQQQDGIGFGAIRMPSIDAAIAAPPSGWPRDRLARLAALRWEIHGLNRLLEGLGDVSRAQMSVREGHRVSLNFLHDQGRRDYAATGAVVREMAKTLLAEIDG